MMKNLLDQMRIDILNAGLLEVRQEWRYKNVNSPYSRIYLITSGSGHFTHYGQKYILEPGYMYLIPAFTLVNLYCPESFRHYYIHITTRLPDGHDLFSLIDCSYKIAAAQHGIDHPIFDRLIELNPGKEVVGSSTKWPVYKSMLDRCAELDRKKSIAQIVESNALIRLILTPFLKSAHSRDTTNISKGINRFQPVIKHIRKNLDSVITLPQLAQLADLNPAYFSDLFTNLMGTPPIRYVNQKRIEKAQTLLLTGNKSLKSIANAVGFTDVFYFSRTFKKFVGLPPAKYRKQILFA